MASNIRYVMETTPKVSFDHEGVRRNRGIKLLFGSEIVQPANRWNQTREIYFGNYFSAGCKPVVIPTHYGLPQTGVNIAPKGLGETKLPDHRGFAVYMWADGWNRNQGKIVHPIHIGYVAAGW